MTLAAMETKTQKTCKIRQTKNTKKIEAYFAKIKNVNSNEHNDPKPVSR